MHKIIGLLRRNPNMTHEEFVTYWKTVHAPLVKRTMPGLIKYIGNFPAGVKVHPDAPEPDWDCIVELGFENAETLQAQYNSAAFMSEERQISSAKLMDLSRTEQIVMEEVVIPVP